MIKFVAKECHHKEFFIRIFPCQLISRLCPISTAPTVGAPARIRISRLPWIYLNTCTDLRGGCAVVVFMLLLLFRKFWCIIGRINPCMMWHQMIIIWNERAIKMVIRLVTATDRLIVAAHYAFIINLRSRVVYTAIFFVRNLSMRALLVIWNSYSCRICWVLLMRYLFIFFFNRRLIFKLFRFRCIHKSKIVICYLSSFTKIWCL